METFNYYNSPDKTEAVLNEETKNSHLNSISAVAHAETCKYLVDSRNFSYFFKIETFANLGLIDPEEKQIKVQSSSLAHLHLERGHIKFFQELADMKLINPHDSEFKLPIHQSLLKFIKKGPLSNLSIFSSMDLIDNQDTELRDAAHRKALLLLENGYFDSLQILITVGLIDPHTSPLAELIPQGAIISLQSRRIDDFISLVNSNLIDPYLPEIKNTIHQVALQILSEKSLLGLNDLIAHNLIDLNHPEIIPPLINRIKQYLAEEDFDRAAALTNPSFVQKNSAALHEISAPIVLSTLKSGRILTYLKFAKAGFINPQASEFKNELHTIVLDCINKGWLEAFEQITEIGFNESEVATFKEIARNEAVELLKTGSIAKFQRLAEIGNLDLSHNKELIVEQFNHNHHLSDWRNRELFAALSLSTSRTQKHPFDNIEKTFVGKINLLPDKFFTQFIKENSIGNIGHTLVTLTLMKNANRAQNLEQLHQLTMQEIQKKKEIVDHFQINSTVLPQTSIGLEYELTDSVQDYYQNTTNRDFVKDIQNTTSLAGIEQGGDGIFEIITQPTDNPYLLLWEIQLLSDLNYIDFNFTQPGFEKTGRGYHLTIGGEVGVKGNSKQTNFLQNALLIAGWGGINAGQEVASIGGIRDAALIEKRPSDIKSIFKENGPAIEFRALSIDSWEPFERSVLTLYYGGIALQVWEKNKDQIKFKNKKINPERNIYDFERLLDNAEAISFSTSDAKEETILKEWLTLLTGVYSDLKTHNQDFFNNETAGYLNEDEEWIDPQDFGGKENQKRFTEITKNSHISLNNYLAQTKISPLSLFTPADQELINPLAHITNLFIKPSENGDQANAKSILSTTKIGTQIEEAPLNSHHRSLLDNKGQRRQGYYYTQGGSEKMIIHAVQKRLLNFLENMQKICSQ